MVTGLQREWWFFKPLKQTYTSDRFWGLIFQIVSFCKTSILIATQKMHHVPANINVFEIQRKAKYHPCSLKFNLPICAVRKSVRRCPSLKILQKVICCQIRKMFTGLRRKWWFSKSFKKSLYQWQLLKSIVSVFGFIKIQYVDRDQNLQMLQKRTARLSNLWRVCVLSSAKNGHWSAARMVVF